jgi:hypothetical protein
MHRVRTHQEAVALAGGAAAFVEGPDDEGLATAAVAGGEDAGDAGGVFLVLGFDVAAGVGFELEGLEERLLGAEEAHGEQHELRGEDFFGAGTFLRAEVAFVVFLPLDIDDVDGLHVAVGIAFEVGGGGEIDAGIVAEFGGGFFLAVVHLVGLGPFGPRIVAARSMGGLAMISSCVTLLQPWRMAGADAVGAGVATADDDDVFVLRR